MGGVLEGAADSFDEWWYGGCWWREEWWLRPEYCQAACIPLESVAAAFEKLKTVFPANWIRGVVEQRAPHRALQDLYAQGLLPFWALYPIGRDLIEVTGCPGYHRLVERLRTASDYTAACSELGIGALLHRKGYGISFSPRVLPSKVPDLLATKAAEEVCIEVKIVGESQRDQLISDLMQELSFALATLHDRFRYRICLAHDLPHIFGPDVKENVRLIKAFVDRIVRRVQQAITLSELPCEIEIEGVALLQLSASGREGSSIESPEISEKNELRRLMRNAFLDAVDQLPAHTPGVVIVGLRFLPSTQLTAMVFRTLFDGEKEKYGHIAAVLLAPQFLLGQARRVGLEIDNPWARTGYLSLPIRSVLSELLGEWERAGDIYNERS
jgi:hypothetical protein